MSVTEKVSSIFRRSTDLRTEVDRAQRELVEAEVMFADAHADPGGRLWKAVEQARSKREQLGVKLRAMEDRERAEAEAAATAERDRKRRELEEALAKATIDAVVRDVRPLGEEAAKISARLVEIDHQREQIVANAVSAASHALNIAREIGDEPAAQAAERATMKTVSFSNQTLTAIHRAVAEANSANNLLDVSRAAQLVDPLWKAS